MWAGSQVGAYSGECCPPCFFGVAFMVLLSYKGASCKDADVLEQIFSLSLLVASADYGDISGCGWLCFAFAYPSKPAFNAPHTPKSVFTHNPSFLSLRAHALPKRTPPEQKHGGVKF